MRVNGISIARHHSWHGQGEQCKDTKCYLHYPIHLFYSFSELWIWPPRSLCASAPKVHNIYSICPTRIWLPRVHNITLVYIKFKLLSPTFHLICVPLNQHKPIRYICVVCELIQQITYIFIQVTCKLPLYLFPPGHSFSLFLLDRWYRSLKVWTTDHVIGYLYVGGLIRSLSASSPMLWGSSIIEGTIPFTSTSLRILDFFYWTVTLWCRKLYSVLSIFPFNVPIVHEFDLIIFMYSIVWYCLLFTTWVYVTIMNLNLTVERMSLSWKGCRKDS